MDPDTCLACRHCDFLTFSTEHLNKHVQEKHDARPADCFPKIISVEASARVRKLDALFYSRYFLEGDKDEDTAHSYFLEDKTEENVAYSYKLEDNTEENGANSYMQEDKTVENVAHSYKLEDKTEGNVAHSYKLEDNTGENGANSYFLEDKTEGNVAHSHLLEDKEEENGTPYLLDEKKEDMADVQLLSVVSRSLPCSEIADTLGKSVTLSFNRNLTKTNTAEGSKGHGMNPKLHDSSNSLAQDVLDNGQANGAPSCASSRPDPARKAFYCLACAFTDVSVDSLKHHTISCHPHGPAAVRQNVLPESFGSPNVTFFCVKELCPHITSVGPVYEEHLMNCCRLTEALLKDVTERMRSTLTFVLDYHNIHSSVNMAAGFLDYVSSFSDSYIAKNLTRLMCSPMIVSPEEQFQAERENKADSTPFPTLKAYCQSNLKVFQNNGSNSSKSFQGIFGQSPSPKPLFCVENLNRLTVSHSNSSSDKNDITGTGRVSIKQIPENRKPHNVLERHLDDRSTRNHVVDLPPASGKSLVKATRKIAERKSKILISKRHLNVPKNATKSGFHGSKSNIGQMLSDADGGTSRNDRTGRPNQVQSRDDGERPTAPGVKLKDANIGNSLGDPPSVSRTFVKEPRKTTFSSSEITLVKKPRKTTFSSSEITLVKKPRKTTFSSSEITLVKKPRKTTFSSSEITLVKKPRKTTPSSSEVTLVKKPRKTTPSSSEVTLVKKPRKTTPSSSEVTLVKKPRKTTPSSSEVTLVKKPRKTTPFSSERTLVKKPRKTTPSSSERTPVKKSRKTSLFSSERTPVKKPRKTSPSSSEGTLAKKPRKIAGKISKILMGHLHVMRKAAKGSHYSRKSHIKQTHLKHPRFQGAQSQTQNDDVGGKILKRWTKSLAMNEQTVINTSPLPCWLCFRESVLTLNGDKSLNVFVGDRQAKPKHLDSVGDRQVKPKQLDSVSDRQVKSKHQDSVCDRQVKPKHLDSVSDRQVKLKPPDSGSDRQAKLKLPDSVSDGQVKPKHLDSVSDGQVKPKYPDSVNDRQVKPKHPHSVSNRQVKPKLLDSVGDRQVKPKLLDSFGDRQVKPKHPDSVGDRQAKPKLLDSCLSNMVSAAKDVGAHGSWRCLATRIWVGNHDWQPIKNSFTFIKSVRDVQESDTGMVKSEQLEMQPTEQQLELQPTDHQLELQPTDQQLELQPTDQKLELQPTDQKLELQPTDHQLELQPTDQQLELQPTDQQLGGKPTDQQLEFAAN